MLGANQYIIEAVLLFNSGFFSLFSFAFIFGSSSSSWGGFLFLFGIAKIRKPAGLFEAKLLEEAKLEFGLAVAQSRAANGSKGICRTDKENDGEDNKIAEYDVIS